MIDLLNYYGLDWAAMLLSVAAMVLIGNKNKYGFVAFLLANLVWITVGATLMHSYGIVIGNAVFLVTNLRGFLKWKQPAVAAPHSIR